MTYNERKKQAVARELAELRALVSGFELVLDDARKIANACNCSIDRLENIERQDDRLTNAIHVADELIARNHFRDLQVCDLNAAIVDISTPLHLVDK